MSKASNSYESNPEIDPRLHVLRENCLGYKESSDTVDVKL